MLLYAVAVLQKADKKRDHLVLCRQLRDLWLR